MQHKLVFIETPDVVETTLALDNYRKACDCGRGAVFFSVARCVWAVLFSKSEIKIRFVHVQYQYGDNKRCNVDFKKKVAPHKNICTLAKTLLNAGAKLLKVLILTDTMADLLSCLVFLSSTHSAGKFCSHLSSIFCMEPSYNHSVPISSLDASCMLQYVVTSISYSNSTLSLCCNLW